MAFCANNPKSAQQKVTEEWDSMAGTWEDVASFFTAALHPILWSKMGIDDPSTLTVLDFGCGTGMLTERIRTQVAHVVALDASPKMMEMVQDKIDTRDWTNVTPLCGILAQTTVNRDDGSSATSNQQPEFRQVVESLASTIDVIVASSVLNFIPDEDLEATCQALGRLLKPNTGRLFHVDWPAGDDQPADGMTVEKATKMYTMAGLTPELTERGTLKMRKDEAPLFYGVAIKR
ncbi:hypothetical protein ACA910_017965 [Epithemia clementina (nom. ined.)]